MTADLTLHLIAAAAVVAALLLVLDAAMGALERAFDIRELAAFVYGRIGQAVLAAATLPIGLGLAFLVRQHGAWVLVAAGVGSFALLELISLSGRPPHGLPRRVPWRLGLWPILRWRARLYLGCSRGFTHRWRLAAGTREDSVGILGPPRSNKTMGVIVPQVLLWGGSAVSTSIKPDVLRATLARRIDLAARHGGRVYVYAPASRGPIDEMSLMRWSPLAGCQDPGIAKLRVDALVAAADTGRGMENGDHWRAGAARILRGYFLAAACHPDGSGDFRWVRVWLSRQEFEGPLAVLRGLHSPGGEQWAAELEGVQNTPERERGSFFSAAENALGATSDPNVMASCVHSDLDVEEFLKTRSTLYVVSPSEHQKAVAPLISALIESIITAAYDLHRRGELPARLLVSLDELANIAALPNLATHVSQGAGQGVNISWAAQSHAQLRDRYGEHTAEAIWSATTAKLILGGLADQEMMRRVSDLVGERRVKTKSRSSSRRNRHGRDVTVSYTWRPRLTTADLRTLRRGWALLLYHNKRAFCLRVPIAYHHGLFRRAMRRRRPINQSPSRPPRLELVDGGLPNETGDSDLREGAEREART